jgi:hypothetical protein
MAPEASATRAMATTDVSVRAVVWWAESAYRVCRVPLSKSGMSDAFASDTSENKAWLTRAKRAWTPDERPENERPH